MNAAQRMELFAPAVVEHRLSSTEQGIVRDGMRIQMAQWENIRAQLLAGIEPDYVFMAQRISQRAADSLAYSLLDTATTSGITIGKEMNTAIGRHENNASFAVALAPDPNIDMFPKADIDWYKKYSLALVGVQQADALEATKKHIITGIEQGKTIPEMMKDLQTTHQDFSQNRLEKIARTETQKIYNRVRYREMMKLDHETGLIKAYEISAVMDNRTCPICGARNGKIVKLINAAGNFPPYHVQCVLPGTRVKTPCGIIAGYRSWYDGTVVKLSLSNGADVSITINHMLATPNGFATAKNLRKGDYILYDCNFEGSGFGNPDDNGSPSLIEDIIGTLAENSGMRTVRVPSSAEHFHGDGRFIDGNIEVITSDSLLRGADKSFGFKHFAEDDLCAGNVSLPRLSGLSELAKALFRYAHATDSVMGGRRESETFLRRGLAHSEEHGLASVARCDTEFGEPISYGTSCNAEMACKSVYGHSGLIEAKNFGGIDIPLVAGMKNDAFCACSQGNAPSNKSRSNNFSANVVNLTDLVATQAGLIKSLEIVNIETFPFAGHVYDLQTFSSLYIANGILSSNCRCITLPVFSWELESGEAVVTGIPPGVPPVAPGFGSTDMVMPNTTSSAQISVAAKQAAKAAKAAAGHQALIDAAAAKKLVQEMAAKQALLDSIAKSEAALEKKIAKEAAIKAAADLAEAIKISKAEAAAMDALNVKLLAEAASQKKAIADALKAAKVQKKIEQAATKAAAEAQAQQAIEKSAVDAAAKQATKPVLGHTVPVTGKLTPEQADAAWAIFGKPENFTGRSSAPGLAGAHQKEYWFDAEGNKWLFKPVSASAGEYVAHGEEASYKIGRLVNPDVVEVRFIRLNGKSGSIQKMRTDLAGKIDFKDVSVANYTPDEIKQIQQEHVIDWLTSNHDGHAEQFLRTKSGTIYGIDKGQGYKFLGKDKLDIDYNPNEAYGSTPVYNDIFKSIKSGALKIDPHVIVPQLKAVRAISDSDLRDLLRPYAESRFPDVGERDKFLKLALGRKNSLQSDFESYYGKVLGKPGFKFEGIDAKTPKVVKAPKTTTVEPAKQVSARMEVDIADAEKLGWQGKAIRVDKGDIEDQSALVFGEKSKSGQMSTVVQLKLRPDAQDAVLNILGKAPKGAGTGVNTAIGAPLPEDIFANDIEAFAKTVNTHKFDGKYNEATITKAQDHVAALKKLAKSDNTDIAVMANDYIDAIHEASASMSKHESTSKFEPYLSQHESISSAVVRGKNDAYTVRETQATLAKRKLVGGDLELVSEKQSLEDIFHPGAFDDKGKQYEIDFGEGIKATYRPWDVRNQYAHSGEFEIKVPEDVSPQSVNKALARMKSIGINTDEPTSADNELMYLQKQAYVLKKHADSDYTTMLAEFERKKLTTDERVVEMRGYWQKQLGVKDITKVHGYNPDGDYQEGFKNKSVKGGYREQYRFDISEAQIAKDMKGYSLWHEVTGGNTVDGLVDTVLGNNGAMISTVEKMRIGVKPGGKSAKADMGTGGASYVFTRIRESADNPSRTDKPKEGLYFKNQMLRRMDAITYANDEFGEVKGSKVTATRQSTTAEWKKIARTGLYDETMFKNSVMLLDNIEHIVVSSGVKRNAVLTAFRKNGIAMLPDGRKIEDVVLSGGRQ